MDTQREQRGSLLVGIALIFFTGFFVSSEVFRRVFYLAVVLLIVVIIYFTGEKTNMTRRTKLSVIDFPEGHPRF
jgi:cell division protein FtsW (lipid II flippase)